MLASARVMSQRDRATEMEAAGLLQRHLRSATLSLECMVTQTGLRTAREGGALEHEDQEAETTEGCLEDWLPQLISRLPLSSPYVHRPSRGL